MWNFTKFVFAVSEKNLLINTTYRFQFTRNLYGENWKQVLNFTSTTLAPIEELQCKKWKLALVGENLMGNSESAFRRATPSLTSSQWDYKRADNVAVPISQFFR